MRAFVSVTNELVEMEEAAAQLAAGIDRGALCANSLGILFCDSELGDIGALLEALGRALGFEVVGCTTQATINPEENIAEMSSALLVLSADDCRFAAALSGPVCRDNCRERVECLYHRLRGRLESDPALMMAFPPHNYDIMIDLYPQLLGELSGNLPVFGGIPGCNAPYGVNACLYGGKVWRDRLLLIMVEGNARPLFSSAVELSHLAPVERTVTKSTDNIIHTIDHMTVPQYLDSIGMDSQELVNDETDLAFVSNPLLLTREGVPVEDYRLIRTLHGLDLEKGTGTALGLVPQGHRIRIGSLTRRDVEVSARRSIGQLLEKIGRAEAADPDYRYAVILAVSCAGRFMVLQPHTGSNGNLFGDSIPPHLCFAGFYALGEFVPTHMKNGVATNTAQNESLTLCAL